LYNWVRFFYRKATPKTRPSYLLEGIQSKKSISIKGYSIQIPVREIFGTIVYDCYNEKLGNHFFETDKTYGVREICSFRDSSDEVFRYHIGIFEEQQYSTMTNVLSSLPSKPR